VRIYFAGGGRCNEYIAKRLIREGHDLVLMDNNEERCHQISEALDARIICGHASSIADWQRAGLPEADMFVACTDSDETNVLACLIADDLAPAAKKAIRLRTPEYDKWQPIFNRLGLNLDRVVHPESDIVERILRVISIPGISDIRDFADGKVKLFSMNLEIGSPLAGMMVADLEKITGHGEAIVGVIFRGYEVIIPDADARLLVGDHVYIVTSTRNLDLTLERIGINKRSDVREVFIVGGGEIGLELARALEKKKISIKLFDEDVRRCEYLASELPNTLVINADGTSQETLMQENIDGIDAFISLTGEEDANLIACLLARRMGVEKVIPAVDRINYLQLAQRLGINTTVNPRIKAADAIFEFVRKGRVLSVRTLGEEAIEAIELLVSRDSVYINRPLSELDLPEGCLVGAILRPTDGILIPDGKSEIQAGDRVVFFVREGSVRELEERFLDSDSLT
jgi:trk system potassium uptake protein TrkA